MFQYVHHIHYLVHDRDAMVEYLEKNFGMKPDHVVRYKNRLEAHYTVDKTQIQIAEPLDPQSSDARYLAKNGPGVSHVAWGVDNIRTLAETLAANGNKLRDREGVSGNTHGHWTLNIDPASSHGLRIQLAEGQPGSIETAKALMNSENSKGA